MNKKEFINRRAPGGLAVTVSSKPFLSFFLSQSKRGTFHSPVFGSKSAASGLHSTASRDARITARDRSDSGAPSHAASEASSSGLSEQVRPRSREIAFIASIETAPSTCSALSRITILSIISRSYQEFHPSPPAPSAMCTSSLAVVLPRPATSFTYRSAGASRSST